MRSMVRELVGEAELRHFETKSEMNLTFVAYGVLSMVWKERSR